MPLAMPGILTKRRHCVAFVAKARYTCLLEMCSNICLRRSHDHGLARLVHEPG
ncbi:hypothetical protein D3C81_2126350 [compost metagenome]